jgi:hypothetical protein
VIVRASLVLRVAAIIALLQWAAHTTLFLRARPTHGAEEIAVVETMKAHHFDLAGSSRSYWDLYFGYGLLAAVVVLVEALLLWQLAGATESARPLVTSIAVLVLAYNVAHLVITARYFFVTPMIPDALIAACLAVALVLLRRGS